MNNFKEMVDNVEKYVLDFLFSNCLKVLFSNVVHTCKSVDYSLLVVPKEGFRLYGSFAFQLIYGRANVNGHECAGKKLSPRNLMCVSAPASGVAVSAKNFRNFTNLKNAKIFLQFCCIPFCNFAFSFT